MFLLGGAFIVIFLLAVFFLICAGFAAALARSRGRSALGWFCLGVFFGPFALLVVLFPAKERVFTKSRAQLGYTDDSDP